MPSKQNFLRPLRVAAQPPSSPRSAGARAKPHGTDAFRVALLRRIPLFACLDDNSLRGLAAVMQTKVYRSHETIIQQGSITGALFVLQAGCGLLIRADDQGREFILGDVRPGDHFGEMSLVDGLPHSASVRTKERSIVLILNGPDFANHLVNHQPFCVEVLKSLTRRLRCAGATISTLALVDVRGRIAHKLMELSQDLGGQRLIRGHLSRTELAKRVGASREMVSRVLTEMQTHGLIRFDAEGDLHLNVEPATRPDHTPSQQALR